MFKKIIRTAILSGMLAVASPVFASPVSYTIDPGHTNVLVSWEHFGFSNPSINFGRAEGVIVYDETDVEKSSVRVTLPLSGLSALADKFDEHLLSEKWFNAEKFPKATFESTKVRKSSGNTLKVDGNLTVRGVTKKVSLNVLLNGKGEHPMKKKPAIGFDATATLKRSDFGLGAYAPDVSDTVFVRITTEAVSQK